MTTTTTERKALFTLDPGDVFVHSTTTYVVIAHRRSKTLIRSVVEGKEYLLSMNAQVSPTGERDLDAVSASVNRQAERTARLTIAAGTKVRIVDNERTRKRGIAGVETVVTRVNSKSYGLANGWRVGPEYVEAIS